MHMNAFDPLLLVFARKFWHFTNGKQIINRDDVVGATSDLSDKVSKDLKERGMKFVGSTIIYSCLQAVGVIDDRAPECCFSQN